MPRTWHYEDPTFGGPYCKHPGYGDFYSADRWPVTQSKKEVTCVKCLDRLTKESKDGTKDSLGGCDY